MRIELSKFEVELLDQALNAWEHEPNSNAALGSIMNSIFSNIGGRQSKDEIREGSKQMRDEALRDTQTRRLQAALLRAKLLQALAVNSEHSCDENPITPPRWKVNDYEQRRI